MTTLIDNNIDELIRRVKTRPEVSGFVFATAFPSKGTVYPGSRYLVTVNDESVKISQFFVGGRVGGSSFGEVYEVKLILRVYAPSGSSSSALLRATSLLADAFYKSDTDCAIRRTELYAVCFDKTARTDYRDVSVTLGYVIYEEAGDD